MRTQRRLLAVAALSGACACAAPQDDAGGPGAPTPASSLFDLLLADDTRVDCGAAGSLVISLLNQNCYVDLCRGTFASASLGAGVFAGTLPRRRLDPDNPTRSLPANAPLLVTLRLGDADPVLEQGEILGTLQMPEFEGESVWFPARGEPRTLSCRAIRP